MLCKKYYRIVKHGSKHSVQERKWFFPFYIEIDYFFSLDRAKCELDEIIEKNQNNGIVFEKCV